jgi:hypothetical protein
MRLNTTQLEQTLHQMNAEVLPDDHPAAAQLTDMFGDHTFLIDQNGLNVVEPAAGPQDDVEAGAVVSLADWSDETLTKLKAHPPSPTGTVVVFDKTKH